MAVLTEKSEIFFIYETQYSQPNGDPFTGEQRYDEETKKVLVSDVRIKRFIRDFLEEKGYPILVSEKVAGGKSSMKEILKKLSADKFKNEKDVEKIMQAHIDVRLFGGISTLKDSEAGGLKNAHTQITGPVQFALLNPSFNRVDLRPHQNTSVLLSKEENTQGAIATTSTVPYALVLIRGWVNPISAKYSGLQQEDLNIMLQALWDSINEVNTRSKHGTSLLLMQVVYKEDKSKVYGLDRKITISPSNGKKEEALRALEDLTLNITDFINAVNTSDKIEEVRYHAAEADAFSKKFEGHTKFKSIQFTAYKKMEVQ